MRAIALLSLGAMVAQSGLVSDIRFAIASGKLGFAEKRLSETQKSTNPNEWLEANSWLARGLLDAGRLEEADQHAVQTRAGALALLAHRKLDADSELPLAMGAAIEVHAQVLLKQGARGEAVTYLRGELVRWRGTTIEPRIYKNLNLLGLEGKPAPPIDVSRWVGPAKPQSLTALRGHPVLLFFWAHWCGDCKAEVSTVQQLLATYGPAGLRVIGPTMHYGFAGAGDEASPERETEWIEATRAKYYSRIGPMPVPVSESALRIYGVSTTPTLVLIDKGGIVRLFHPGIMSYGELAPFLSKLI